MSCRPEDGCTEDEPVKLIPIETIREDMKMRAAVSVHHMWQPTVTTANRCDATAPSPILYDINSLSTYRALGLVSVQG